ncbi:hypothetical protein JXO52_00440 [bacterium]|nr:hypothetical protein [bacterium]
MHPGMSRPAPTLLHFLLLFTAVITVTCANPLATADPGAPPDAGVTDGPAVTRSEIILKADTFARLHWTMTEENRTGPGAFVSTYPVGDRIGVGYKWSGWNTVAEFIEGIEAGWGTGTGAYVTYQDYPIESVVGVSCTGFVSRAWQLNNKYTLNYPDRPDILYKFSRITCPVDGVDLAGGNFEALKKGDAFINSGHIILYVYTTRDNRIMIMDSSIEGVRFRALPWYFFSQNGYQAIRYNNIVEISDPAGTMTNPIMIPGDGLPYTHSGSTRDVVSMEFDRYSAALEMNEQGPEVVYRLHLPAAADLSATVTDIKEEGIDNDIFLLTSLDRDGNRNAVDVIAGGDNTISATVAAGVYYLVVDSGADRPGEYVLTVHIK